MTSARYTRAPRRSGRPGVGHHGGSSRLAPATRLPCQGVNNHVTCPPLIKVKVPLWDLLWRDNATYGVLGDGSTTDRLTPFQVGLVTADAEHGAMQAHRLHQLPDPCSSSGRGACVDHDPGGRGGAAARPRRPPVRGDVARISSGCQTSAAWRRGAASSSSPS